MVFINDLLYLKHLEAKSKFKATFIKHVLGINSTASCKQFNTI